MCEDRDNYSGDTAASRYLSGAYDVPCSDCGASGKVREPDFGAMPSQERRAYVAFLREQRARAVAAREILADYAAERRMGC